MILGMKGLISEPVNVQLPLLQDALMLIIFYYF